jgi:hypothetical protein
VTIRPPTVVIAGRRRVLDRLQRQDARSFAWPAAPALREAAPVTRDWSVRAVLDQGSEGACVGFGWAHESLANPVPCPWVDAAYARRIYRDAQRLDQWPGDAYEGTSVLAGAKAAIALGLITSYRWCSGLDEILRAISHHGPVVAGIRWHRGMADPGPTGRIRPTGPVLGGHCVAITAIDIDAHTVSGPNSWGYAWGHHGHYTLSWDDLEALLPGGDFCVPQLRADPGPPAPPAPKPRRRWWPF